MLRIFRSRVEAEPPAHFNLRRQRDRAAGELVGLSRGVLADGAVSSQEARFLLDWCERNAYLGSDAPPIGFAGSAFVVTGTFAYGARAAVAGAIIERGSDVKPTITKKADYLVIGEIGSQAWKHSSWARKIKRAVVA